MMRASLLLHHVYFLWGLVADMQWRGPAQVQLVFRDGHRFVGYGAHADRFGATIPAPSPSPAVNWVNHETSLLSTCTWKDFLPRRRVAECPCATPRPPVPSHALPLRPRLLLGARFRGRTHSGGGFLSRPPPVVPILARVCVWGRVGLTRLNFRQNKLRPSKKTQQQTQATGNAPAGVPVEDLLGGFEDR